MAETEQEKDARLIAEEEARRKKFATKSTSKPVPKPVPKPAPKPIPKPESKSVPKPEPEKKKGTLQMLRENIVSAIRGE